MNDSRSDSTYVRDMRFLRERITHIAGLGVTPFFPLMFDPKHLASIVFFALPAIAFYVRSGAIALQYVPNLRSKYYRIWVAAALCELMFLIESPPLTLTQVSLLLLLWIWWIFTLITGWSSLLKEARKFS